MQFQYTPYILPLVIACSIAVFVAVKVWRLRATASGATALVPLALAIAEWSLGYALEIAGADLPTKIFWGKSQYIGIVAIPLLWVIFTYSHLTQGTRMTRRNVTLLSIVPLITLILAFTTEYHGLIWKDIRIQTVGTFSALAVTHGFWFWVYWVYSNILLLAGTIFILRSFKRTMGLFRRQNLILLIAVLTPWVGNVLYVTGFSPIPFMDLTPFALTISAVAFALGIYRFQLGNLAPVARDLVVEKMPDGMIVLDAQGNIVDINPALQNALGVSASQVIGQRSKDVFNAWPSLVERYENILEAQDEIVLGEGETQRWIELRLAPLVDSRNRLLGRVVTARDVTTRKQMEEALRLSEEKYRKIYENVSDVIYETDNQGKLTSISPSIERRGGFQPEELIGRHVMEFFVFPEQYAALDALILEHGAANDFEALLQRKDGNRVWVSITSHIVFDANGQGVATEGVLRDITERKQAEESIRQMNAELESRVSERTSQLQESNAYLTALIEISIALNESLDLNEVLDRILVQVHKVVPARALNVMFVEGEYARIVRRIGYQGLEKIEQSLLDLRFPISWPTFHQMRTSRKGLYISDTARDTRWQNIQSAEWVRSFIGVPLVVSDEIIGFLNAGHSEPNFFDAKHAFMLESLAHHAAVAIQNARLLDELKKALEKEQGMRDRLVHADKLAALGKMVAVIAHEINNPIQTVKNSLYLLEDQIMPGSPAKEYLKMASAEADRISDLVAQLRGTYASSSKAMVPVDVFTLLLEVHELLASQLKKRKVEWLQANGHRSYTVLAVRNNLKQVFINLCLNAMEAIEADQERRLIVSLHTDQDGQRVGVDFHNTGSLISEEALPHIFEPFFTTKKTGTGLGLSISYDIIRQHQGEILVENVPGEGVTFTVWLPLALSEEDGDES
ncbi:MAG TPA: histidine kinase N-terminal 7TM domain-containing protein [Anaerolineales bacterium]|nr:histidine kinase N-terminal 7TM domain-containing protein [Anaerolineales bacterium]